MKNKLHTMLRQAQQPQAQQPNQQLTVTEPSRSAASHPVCHSVGISKYKASHFKILLFSILYSLFSIPTTAQQYKWDWAVSGGGTYGTLGFDHNAQQIYDIKVGSDNNYYFIATIKNGTPQLNGQPVTVYSPNNSVAGGRNDIFLFSTTNTGTIRWSQSIGGGADNIAYNLVLDSSNNVYIGAFLRSDTNNNPIHFSATDAITAAYQTNYLVKYDSNGVFQTKKALQGIVANEYLGIGQLFDLVIDSQDRLHFVVGLQKGTHLDGNVWICK